ncbi:MAG TPA: bifunctional serine/threonine-protein kinase/formylglycine-generating enzyme family protein [Pyrinomonadaceae bacterium]
MKECPACKRCFPDHVNHCPHDGDATTHSIAGEPILDGRYQLEKRLGHGGMGVVFKARHIFLKTAHAIKVILPDLVGNDPMLVTRFRQEALAAAAIRHQNIIAVTDFGVARGTMPFLVMEFVQGKSLHDILVAEKSLPPSRALELMSAIGAGVAAAHRQNIVHRDLKPLNIMIQDEMSVSEGLKILDFGLAKIKSGELLGSFVQAKTSGLMGSPFYMAPEQWSDEEPDARADIYSLGVIAYQMLSGDVPFKGTSIPSIMKKHLTAAPATFAEMGVQVPSQIEAVVRHALEKEALNRPASVEAFLNELRDAVASASLSLNRTQVGHVSIDSATIITPPAAQTGQQQAQRTSDNLAGTISSGSLDDDYEHQQSSASMEAARLREQATALEERARQAAEARKREQERREQEERDRIAREELEREEAARLQAQAEAKRKAEEEAARQRAEEEARLRAEQEAKERAAEEARQRAAEEARVKAEAAAKERAAEEARRRAEHEAQLRAETEARRKAEEETARLRLEAEARKKAEAEAAQLRAEAEAARQKTEADAARRRADEEARLRAEEEARQRREATERERQQREQREREERDRAERERAEHERAERERAERERAERERAERQLAATSIQDYNASQPPVDFESTQQQRGMVTQALGNDSLPGVGQQQSQPGIGQQSQNAWQQQSQSGGLHASVAPGFPGAEEKKKSSLPLILAAAVIGFVVLVGGGAGIYFATRSTPQPAKPPGVNNGTGTNAGSNTQQATKSKAELIAIPAGTFQMGRNDGPDTESPAHKVSVNAFAMDKTEVTNAEYEEFVNATNYQPPGHWADGKPLAGQEQWPVTNVSVDDAKAFAAWRSKRDGVIYRLPTEEEWEYAARGGEQDTLYPWGSSWSGNRAVVDEASPKPVGSFPEGKNRWGVLDLVGNVWEWTSSKAAYYPGNSASVTSEYKDSMVYRGGSYATKTQETQATGTLRNWQKPSTKHPTLGFRLVRSGS